MPPSPNSGCARTRGRWASSNGPSTTRRRASRTWRAPCPRREEGHVLTVEPGLYLQPDDETLPPELRGMGVRIEDDLVITADGARLLSDALPRAADDVEEWMARLLDD